MNDDWIAHPSRFETGADKPGRNGHFRTLSRPRPGVAESTCLGRVKLPAKLGGLADGDGWITFGGKDWAFVVGAAHVFAREHAGAATRPFGYCDGGQWWWWDQTTSTESILDTLTATDYVEEYLRALFPGCQVAVIDNR